LKLLDVNILVYAHREDAPRHEEFRGWLLALMVGEESFGVPALALSGFLRVVTHPRIFDPPSPLERALAFAEEVRGAPRCIEVPPAENHWEVFTRLCREANAKGNLVPDAWFAALAVGTGSEWISTDRDFARFPGLRWRHPLDG
jgi:toxin-antitoxin system PIN domain toxin